MRSNTISSAFTSNPSVKADGATAGSLIVRGALVSVIISSYLSAAAPPFTSMFHNKNDAHSISSTPPVSTSHPAYVDALQRDVGSTLAA